MLKPGRVLARARGGVGRPRHHVTLAIETSCDDTGVAVLRQGRGGHKVQTELLFNEREASDNRAFGGVNPRVAVQAHNERLALLVKRALAALAEAKDEAQDDAQDEAQDDAQDDAKAANSPPRRRPDLVAATRGPGIASNLSVGLNMAKGLAVAWDVPFAAVHHMQAHALTPRLAHALGLGPPADFPFASLLVSGGHTQLVLSSSLTHHRVIASTADIAVGNLLDQTARVILPPDLLAASPDVMYGRQLDAFAFASPHDMACLSLPLTRADELAATPTGYSWSLPVPLCQTRRLAFSFAAIHSAVHRIAHAAMPLQERRALARHTLLTAFQHIASRLCIALDDDAELRSAATRLVLSGGVAANSFLAHVLRSTLDARRHSHVGLLVSPPALCTDNAAMIAWTALEMYQAGWLSHLSAIPLPRWSMDAAVDKGVLGGDALSTRPSFEPS
ncbi:hypothetical protein CDD81_6355 [Ophiocordyceps australis]|uniref:Gcp-like domain-containing protein n=1 Tax=Ophiocordyceps australis TaxID=1399860 RepID=A0A2C5Y7U0_9HYPO|nr:hypothetical protein CDD81_6355 [Ophiocordyceps australis]